MARRNVNPGNPPAPRPRNIVSVDVEDYFHVEAFSAIVPRERWESYACRVEPNTHRVLDLFDQAGVKATFFILGWVAERYPHLVREIVSRGHEPACHSYWHRLIYSLTPAEFAEDTKRAKACIEQAAGMPVHGYRAPSFSITPRSLWAPTVLAEAGFTYDSSIYPVHHDTYGFRGVPRRPFVIQTAAGNLTEFPMPTFKVGSLNMPFGGGGYLRIFPSWYTRLGLRRAWAEGLPVVSYIHPWEFDPEQPRMRARLKSRLRHYTNLSHTAERLRRLLALGDFRSFRDRGFDDATETLDLRNLKQ
ncbi:MAG TPA: XrtA system polysaccharide deacetylase [Bryobacteraceae bacterium]|jgi:polysaccharide deacetylase family protein (PEP-CTERM system associated)|nr:XrtA system polysaccharide deacetylase [Bryobacteraceae bacterium]